MNQKREIRLPPLNSLRVFNLVMRHRNIQAASIDLHVTPQAVSAQIKLLEEFLGRKLFTRVGRRIEPTEKAILLDEYIESAFNEIINGIKILDDFPSASRININVTPYFATRYLIQKLQSFQAKYPDCDLRMTSIPQIPNFGRDEIDIAINWGYGNWPKFKSRRLVHDHKIICCSPEYLNSHKLASARDLPGHTLLDPIAGNTLWRDLFKLLRQHYSTDIRHMRMTDNASMRQAAIQGLGLGLISLQDAHDDIKQGKLVAPLGTDLCYRLPEDKVPGFYVIYPKINNFSEMATHFLNWLTQLDWQEKQT